jgi:hypothetical protein
MVTGDPLNMGLYDATIQKKATFSFNVVVFLQLKVTSMLTVSSVIGVKLHLAPIRKHFRISGSAVIWGGEDYCFQDI